MFLYLLNFDSIGIYTNKNNNMIILNGLNVLLLDIKVRSSLYEDA